LHKLLNTYAKRCIERLIVLIIEGDRKRGYIEVCVDFISGEIASLSI